MDMTYSKCGFISWWCAMQGGHEWLISPLRRYSFVYSFSRNVCRMRFLHYFPAVQMQRWWAGAHGRLQTGKKRGVEMATGLRDWCPVYLCAAPDDTCSVSVTRHLLIGRDEISRYHGDVNAYMCDWVKGSVRYRLKERKVTQRKSESREREEKLLNKTERTLSISIWTFFMKLRY